MMVVVVTAISQSVITPNIVLSGNPLQSNGLSLRSALEYVIRIEVLYQLNYYRGSNLLAAMMLQLNNPAQLFGTRAGGL